MSEDIVERLLRGSIDEATLREAAAEITRLRDELAKVIAMGRDIVDGRE